MLRSSHVPWRCHLRSNLGFEVGGNSSYLYPSSVCLAFRIAFSHTLSTAVHQHLCWVYCLCGELPRALPYRHRAAEHQKREAVHERSAVTSPETRLLCYCGCTLLLNHNSGGCSGNFGFLQQRWLRGKPLTSGRSHVARGCCAWSSWAPAWRIR